MTRINVDATKPIGRDGAMKFQVREEGDTRIVVLEGDIDLEFSGDVREVLLESLSKARKVVVEMSGVSLIDSSGVASLLEGFQSARKRGKEFVLAAVGESVMRVLKLARLDTVFSMVEDVSAGIGETE